MRLISRVVDPFPHPPAAVDPFLHAPADLSSHCTPTPCITAPRPAVPLGPDPTGNGTGTGRKIACNGPRKTGLGSTGAQVEKRACVASTIVGDDVVIFTASVLASRWPKISPVVAEMIVRRRNAGRQRDSRSSLDGRVGVGVGCARSL